MENGRCRLHGGKSIGPPKGNKNALKSGEYTAETKALKRYMNDLLRESKKLVKEIKGR